MSVSYEIVPKMRWEVIRSESTRNTGFETSKGEFANEDIATAVATALCEMERQFAGAPLDSTEFVLVKPSS